MSDAQKIFYYQLWLYLKGVRMLHFDSNSELTRDHLAALAVTTGIEFWSGDPGSSYEKIRQLYLGGAKTWAELAAADPVGFSLIADLKPQG